MTWDRKARWFWPLCCAVLAADCASKRIGRMTAVGAALVAGGALGNLLDRLRSPYGVVDFICGAVVLIWSRSRAVWAREQAG